jgi:hypothetical protein
MLTQMDGSESKKHCNVVASSHGQTGHEAGKGKYHLSQDDAGPW